MTKPAQKTEQPMSDDDKKFFKDCESVLFKPNPDALEILNFLNDPTVWSKHKSYFFSGTFPETVKQMRDAIKLNKSNWDDMLHVRLRSLAQHELQNISEKGTNPWNPPAKNLFAIYFYYAVSKAQSLDEIVSYIHEVQQTGEEHIKKTVCI